MGPCFRRALNDWEIGEVANLLGVLNSHPAFSMRPDKPRWKLHNKGGHLALKINPEDQMPPKGSLFLLVGL